jgi:putative DNA-invertase from lambdoid prophage Rac
LSSLAKVEAQKVFERTKAGMERARRNGTKIGRPALEESVRSHIAQRLAKGATPFAVARALGIDRKTVLKYAGHLPCDYPIPPP